MENSYRCLTADLVSVAVGRKFNIINKCSYTIWPAYYSDVAGFPEDRGFQLNAGQSRVITLPVPSPGLRIWARTGYVSTLLSVGRQTVIKFRG
jgi:Thaumatin family